MSKSSHTVEAIQYKPWLSEANISDCLLTIFEVISFFCLNTSLVLSILSPRLHKCYDYRRICTHRIQFTLKMMVARKMKKGFHMEDPRDLNVQRQSGCDAWSQVILRSYRNKHSVYRTLIHVCKTVEENSENSNHGFHPTATLCLKKVSTHSGER